MAAEALEQAPSRGGSLAGACPGQRVAQRPGMSPRRLIEFVFELAEVGCAS